MINRQKYIADKNIAQSYKLFFIISPKERFFNTSLIPPQHKLV